MKSITIAFAALLSTLALPARAELEIFACEPEWAALATELGGNLVSAESATTPQQDPHYIQARPSLIAKMRRAALVICTGADLEVGWLPLLLRQAGNAAVQPGQPGSMTAADYVDMLDKPSSVDRSLGDIHPYGNPHIQTDPRNIGKVAAALAERLATLDSANAATYRARFQDFDARWRAAVERWTAAVAPLKGKQVVTHHKGWVYLETLGRSDRGRQPRAEAGIAAERRASRRLARSSSRASRSPRSSARSTKTAKPRNGSPDERRSRRSSLPHTVGSVPGADDLFGMFDVTVKTLVEAQQ